MYTEQVKKSCALCANDETASWNICYFLTLCTANINGAIPNITQYPKWTYLLYHKMPANKKVQNPRNFQQCLPDTGNRFKYTTFQLILCFFR
ncbi:hypothetical protein B4V02_10575 [Paenibacillus kribbensis]|uniref:Uncharacterized protein n=1 Tax=Paenibacillus kribbensis TaxID=172713 RepID=A0A222WVY0_9BACL|nr:hypothetical protein B4V02_10575 [Paenibacillus kribbensis]